MEEYNKPRPNNRDPNLEKKDLTPVAKGKIVKKKSGFRRAQDIFVREDFSSVESDLLTDILGVIIPSFKNTITTIVRNTIDSFLYDGVTSRIRSKGPSSSIEYHRISDDKRPSSSTKPKSRFGYDELVVDTRQEAEDVLNRMQQIIEAYGIVNIADMYDLLGQTAPYTSQKYGWTNIRNASIIRVPDGYAFDMPKVMPID